ncbi:MAG: hypothetical protein AAF363_19770 [Bacteroidota bacterium]
MQSKDHLKVGLASLERKVRFLISEKQKMSDEIHSLKLDNDNLKGKLSDREDQIEDLKNKLNLNRIVTNINSEEGSEEVEGLKGKIDEYIREIDRCIVQLSE